MVLRRLRGGRRSPTSMEVVENCGPFSLPFRRGLRVGRIAPANSAFTTSQNPDQKEEFLALTMSFSDSDSSSQCGDHKSFKQISRERLLHEMLRSAKTGDSKSTWKVLIMDKLTVKIMSYACKMADITDEGVS
ncbi:SNARE-interacting protein KEULE, partial [Cucurbita argyrosperma subsp. argyrosperma]